MAQTVAASPIEATPSERQSRYGSGRTKAAKRFIGDLPDKWGRSWPRRGGFEASKANGTRMPFAIVRLPGVLAQSKCRMPSIKDVCGSRPVGSG